MKGIIIPLAVLFLSGCANHQMISDGGKFTTPDGVETYFTIYRDDVNPFSDGVVAVVKKECHVGKGDHRVLPGTKKHDGKYHCGPSETLMGVTPGIVRSIFTLGGFWTRHSGKPYAEGDTTNVTSGSSSNSKAKAKSASKSVSKTGKRRKKH